MQILCNAVLKYVTVQIQIQEIASYALTQCEKLKTGWLAVFAVGSL